MIRRFCLALSVIGLVAGAARAETQAPIPVTNDASRLTKGTLAIERLPTPVNLKVTPSAGDGSTTSFTVPAVSNPALLTFVVGGVNQSGAFTTTTANGVTTITFAAPPAVNATISASYGALQSAASNITSTLIEQALGYSPLSPTAPIGASQLPVPTTSTRGGVMDAAAPDNTYVQTGMSAGVPQFTKTMCPLTGCTLTGLFAAPSIVAGSNTGGGYVVNAAGPGTTTNAATLAPFNFFDPDAYATTSTQASHNSFVIQENLTGNGPRNTLNVVSNFAGTTASKDFLVSGQFLDQLMAGAGFAIALAPQVVMGPNVGAGSQMEGIEMGLSGTISAANLQRKVGLNIIDSVDALGSTLSAGVLINHLNPSGQTSPGFQHGVLFGFDAFPITAGGDLVNTLSEPSGHNLNAAFDLHNLNALTDAAIISPFGNVLSIGAGGGGGRIVGATGSGGPFVLFSTNQLLINTSNNGASIAIFGATASSVAAPFTAPSVTVASLPTSAPSGTKGGNVCYDTSKVLYGC